MPPRVPVWWEGYVTGLSDAGFTFSRIIEMCKRRNFKISKSVIHRICQQSKAGLPSGERGTPVVRRKRKAPSRTQSVVEKVKELVTSENPDTNKNIAQCVGVSKTTVGRIITETLGLVKRPVKKKKKTSSATKVKSKHQTSAGQATMSLDVRGKVNQRTLAGVIGRGSPTLPAQPETPTTTTTMITHSGSVLAAEQPSGQYLYNHVIYPNNCYQSLSGW